MSESGAESYNKERDLGVQSRGKFQFDFNSEPHRSESMGDGPLRLRVQWVIKANL